MTQRTNNKHNKILT